MSKRKIVINEIPVGTSEISQNGTEEKIDKDLDYFGLYIRKKMKS